MDARIFLNMLGCVFAAGGVPLVVVVATGTILHRRAPGAGMESHHVIWLYIVNREPPVQLAGGSRVPGVTMRMEGLSYARGEITVTRCCA